MLVLWSFCLSVCSSAGDLPDNHLLLARLLHGIRRVFVVHGIDLAGATDNWGIGNRIRNLLHDRAIGASLKRGRQNGRGFVAVGDLGQGDDIVVELVGFKITDQLDETGLLKQNQSVLRSSYRHSRAGMVDLPGDPQTERRSCPCRDACKPEAFWQWESRIEDSIIERASTVRIGSILCWDMIAALNHFCPFSSLCHYVPMNNNSSAWLKTDEVIDRLSSPP